jgi:hypothetical protein
VADLFGGNTFWNNGGQSQGSLPVMSNGVQSQAGTNSIGNLLQPNLFPSSFSGVNPNFSNNILAQIAPLLTQGLGNLPSTPGNFMKSQAGGVLQDTINGLASRNMLSSSVASDTLAKTASNLGGTAMQMQSQIPTMLGQLATNLGSQSMSSNPLAPYELLSNFVLNY